MFTEHLRSSKTAACGCHIPQIVGIAALQGRVAQHAAGVGVGVGRVAREVSSRLGTSTKKVRLALRNN